MSPPTPPPTAADSSPPVRPAASGLAGLAAMSTTAGVGVQEYKAINPFAVASLVTGMASALVWLHPLLYALPVLSVAFGAWAIARIRASNGTEGGTWLAVAGLVLGIGFGGVLAARELRSGGMERTARLEIEETFGTLGQALAEGRHADAYALMAPAFREEVPPEEFDARLTAITGGPGSVTGAHSNGLAQVEVDPEGRATAQALLIVEFADRPEPSRLPAMLERTPDGWRIRRMLIWFPPDPSRAGAR